MASSDQFKALADQLESVLHDPSGPGDMDPATRRRLVASGRKLSVLLEEPRETGRRIGYAHLQLPLSLVGIESKLFATLATEPRSFTLLELSEKTGIDKQLLKRLLRYYQAVDILAQVDDDAYQATNVTRALANDDHANSHRWTRRITARGALHLPDWLQKHEYKDPVGILPTAWSGSIPTDDHPYGYLAKNPWALELAQAHMRVQREGRPVFFDAMDFEQRFAQGATSDTVLFVDIGGATGPQARELRKRFPDLPGRVLLQDRPEVAEKWKDDLAQNRIEAVVHDIFTPQNVKGARVYYLRNIFHAWGDKTCTEILINAKEGLTEDSVLLIDEIVLPERDATPQGAQHDIEVMICVGGIERTKAQWENLLATAGLKLKEVINYDDEFEDSVIVAGL
ncbi:unnamed protein product [Periconia digitata]|uniref:O-methyltransferase C-terminal domain-containing protein n=1 Tax=Periconia digitata TaxID=1303443 RepID=A0A9W4U0M3_9PLEO|nr:unnamed protein product [Periconia digitata]